MTAFKEGFDESKFGEFQKAIKGNYSGLYSNPDEVFDICEQVVPLIGQALHSKRHFADGVRVIDRFANNAAYYGAKWVDLAWSTFADNQPAIEKAISNGDDEQVWVVVDTISDLSIRRSRVKGLEPVDFLVKQLGDIVSNTKVKSKAVVVLQTIIARGDEGHIQFVRDFILKSFENPDPQVRRAAANWVYDFRAGIYRFGIEDTGRISAEEDYLENKFLEKYELPSIGVIEDWQRHNGDLRNNLLTISELGPEVARTLHSEFWISNFGRYSTELLARQFDQRNERALPYIAILFPKHDYSGIFQWHPEAFKGLLQQSQDEGYELRVTEWESQVGIVRAINRLRKRYGKIAHGVLGGHGGPDWIHGGFDKNKGTLWASDVLRFPSSAFAQAFEDDPTIVLVSCSTGKTSDGIAQAIADLGARVTAPNQDTDIEKFDFKKSDGQITLNASYRYPTQAKLFYPRPERKTS